MKVERDGSEEVAGNLLVEQEAAEPVDPHRNGDRLSPVQELGDTWADRRPLLGRARREVEEPPVPDRVLDPRDPLEVDGPAHFDPPLAEAPSERYSSGLD